jgi:hypothetical protein
MNNETDASSKSQTINLMDLMVNVLSRSALILFCLLLFFYGATIAGTVLKEPDICFLLAAGRWTVEHGQIPQQDPFSYTAHLLPAKYILEKWLAEVIFYGVWAGLGGACFLVLDTCCATLAFVIIPYRVLCLCGWRGLPALLLVMLLALTSFAHLAARPEIFSFLFLAIWFEVLVRMQKRTADNTDIDWKSIILLGFLMCLWVNMHTLFLFGMLLPGVYTACVIGEKFFPELRKQPFNFTGPILMVVCILASLVNPWGFDLWTYMPFVFGRFTETNNEMQPLGLKNALTPAFFPFYLAVLIGLRVFFLDAMKRPYKSGDLFYRLLIPLGIAGGFKVVRSIPLSGWFILTALAGSVIPAWQTKNKLLTAIDAKIEETIKPFSWSWTLVCLLISAMGTVLITMAVPPQAPQGSAAFTPPLKAIQFIEEHPPKGNLLNDPHFGNVMEWQMQHNPPVFIDSRYNLFPYDLLQDYWKIVQCADGWQDLLKKYDIGWVFLPPNLELPKRLAQDPNWHLLYSDKASVVYQRAIPTEGSQHKDSSQ